MVQYFQLQHPTGISQASIHCLMWWKPWTHMEMVYYYWLPAHWTTNFQRQKVINYGVLCSYTIQKLPLWSNWASWVQTPWSSNACYSVHGTHLKGLATKHNVIHLEVPHTFYIYLALQSSETPQEELLQVEQPWTVASPREWLEATVQITEHSVITLTPGRLIYHDF